MVDIYASDDEKAEQLKEWWRKNGLALILGLVIGLGAVFGWRAWNEHREQQAEEASLLYSQVLVALGRGDAEGLLENSKQLLNQHSGSAYAVLAAFAVANQRLQGGEAQAAIDHLRWAMEHAKDPAMEQLARLRLGRVLLAEGDADAALELIPAERGPYEAGFAELQGDIHAARGDAGKARAAYQRALALADPASGKALTLRMKLDDVGGADGGPGEAG